jgi:hypothetical protein
VRRQARRLAPLPLLPIHHEGASTLDKKLVGRRCPRMFLAHLSLPTQKGPPYVRDDPLINLQTRMFNVAVAVLSCASLLYSHFKMLTDWNG